MNNKILAGIAVLISLTAIFFSIGKTNSVKTRVDLGNAFSRVATSSTIAIGPQENKTLFTARQTCSSRIITTVAQPVMLSFHSSVVPTALAGHLQAASTTVVYKSDDYGCGAVSAYGYTASTTITTSEFSL